MRRNSHRERALWGRLHSNRRRVFLKRLSCAPQQAKTSEQIDQAGAVVDWIQEEREAILTVLGPLFLFPQRGGWRTAELLDWATENLLVEVHRNRCLDWLYMLARIRTHLAEGERGYEELRKAGYKSLRWRGRKIGLV